MVWQALATAGIGLLDNVLGSNSARRANEANIRLQRQQQDWEAAMSNSAVMRRKKDLERAGGNPALAFTGGQEASTPSIAPARVEPEYRPGSVTNTAISAMQAMNLAANTRKTTAEAQRQEMINNADNPNLIERKGLELDLLRMKKQMGEKEFDDIIPKRIELITSQIKATEAQAANSAAQAERVRRTIDDMAKLLEQQVRAGKLDLDALENLATVGGIEGSKATGIVKTMLDAIRVFTKEK